MIARGADGQDRLECLGSCLDRQWLVVFEQRTLCATNLSQHEAWEVNTTRPLQHQVLRHGCKLTAAVQAQSLFSLHPLANTHPEGELLPTTICCCPTLHSL